jgi:thiosulfate/3-mercaptopyruvate sulfurtransferase
MRSFSVNCMTFFRNLALTISVATMTVAAPKPRTDLLVTTDWLAQHLKDSNVVVLQVSRDSKAYDEGHIPGSRFLALGDITTTKDGILNELPPAADLKTVFEKAGVSDNSRVILVADVSPVFPSRAFFTLDYLGHDKTAMLDGGLPKWKMESRPLETAKPEMKMGRLTPHVRPEIVATKQNVSAVSKSGSSVLVDARPAADHNGTLAPNAEIPRPGHIPGSVNFFWQQGQVNKDDMSLLSETQLRKAYEDAGVKSDKPVITYCNTGMQASQSYFTLKYLGYDVKMYDGSFSEWSESKDTEVQK